MFWCLGMFSSASTWTFNVVQKIALTVAPTRPLTSIFLDVDAVLPDLDDASGTLIVKNSRHRGRS